MGFYQSTSSINASLGNPIVRRAPRTTPDRRVPAAECIAVHPAA